MTPEWHWYSFAWMYLDENNRGGFYSCTSGFGNMQLNKACIKEAEKQAGAPNGSILLSVSYLGYQTKKQFMEMDCQLVDDK